jgi:hypothetical protein
MTTLSRLDRCNASHRCLHIIIKFACHPLRPTVGDTHHQPIEQVTVSKIDVKYPIGARTVEMNCERCKKMRTAFVGCYKSSFDLLSHQ